MRGPCEGQTAGLKGLGHTGLGRADLELLTLQAIPDRVERFGAKHYSQFDRFLDGTFGFSYLGSMLYANGRNDHSLSARHPTGLVYNDGETFFSFAYFRKKHQPTGDFHLHIIAPKGQRPIDVARSFVDRLRQEPWFPSGSAYLRHLTAPQFAAAKAQGCRDILADPWHPDAVSEDETYNHRLVHIPDIFDPETQSVRLLAGEASRGYCKKAKMAYNRFVNFLERNRLCVDFIDYDPEQHAQLGRQMIVRHFATLEDAVGSTPEDYFNILDYFPRLGRGEVANRSCGFVGSLTSETGLYLPLILFIGERISRDTMALYATFSLRDPANLPRDTSLQGFTAISQFAYIEIFRRLLGRGIHYADLGGSEKPNLDTFKRQLGAREVPTFWAVL